MPLLFEQILGLMVGMLDTVMVSSVGEAAISGVSIVNDVNLLIIALLSAQLRFLYTVGYYHSAGYKDSDIMDIVGTRSSFRLKKAYEALENFNLREIMQLLDKLCDLDYRFKIDSQIDEKLKLELFLMELL